MYQSKDLSFGDIRAKGAITLADVMRLRRDTFADGIVNVQEADALFALNDACAIKDTAWSDFFVEALSDYLVHQAEPKGYVTTENADWLIGKIGRDGKVDTMTELELLISVLDKARWAPSSLAAFALDQVKRSVLTGCGPVRSGKKLVAGVVDAADVDILRRILYAFGSHGNVAITRAEAEVLFDINDATDHARNAPEWTELFTKAVANCIMSASGYEAPPREEALRLERWLNQEPDGVGGFLSRMVSGGFKAMLDAYGEQTAEERELERLERQKIAIITAEPVTDEEGSWIANRIARNGVIDENEKALLSFIKKECVDIAPSLKSVLDKVA
jgi:hypothetical protein